MREMLSKIRSNGLLVLLIAMSVSAYSQENYISGYIINNKNETITGFIDFRDWVKNPSFIDFKKNSADNPLRVKPSDIIEFGVNNEIYAAAAVDIEVTPSSAKDLEPNPELKIKKDTVFLLAVLRGDKELYYYNNEDSRVNFYIKTGSEFELLVQKLYLKQVDLRRIIIENKTYLGQLSLYLNDCPDIQSVIARTSYSLKGMTDLFRFYNQNSASDITFLLVKQKLTAEFGIIAGATFSTIRFVGGALKYLERGDVTPSLNFSAGVFLDITLPRHQGKWSIINELFLSSYNIQTTYDDVFNNSLITTDFNNTYLKLNNMARFSYPAGPFLAFFNGGVSNGYAIKATNDKESDFYNANRIEEGVAIPITRNYELGILLGAGVKRERFSFETRIEMGNGMSKVNTVETFTTRYHFLLGYKF
jgi:hypothetical protein